MTIEGNYQFDYAHCAGTHCEKASQCLHHTTNTILGISTKERYIALNLYVAMDAQFYCS